MESSIAEFLKRKLACELLPTSMLSGVVVGGVALCFFRAVTPGSLTHQCGWSVLSWTVPSPAVQLTSESVVCGMVRCAISGSATHQCGLPMCNERVSWQTMRCLCIHLRLQQSRVLL